MAYFLVGEAYRIALPIFFIVALSDLVDGYIARKFNLASRLGATLDPIADKLNMLVATLVLASQMLVPIWLALAVILRDVIIVLGALVYRRVLGHIEIAPTRLSKINTFLEFAVLLLVMASAAGWIEAGTWLSMAFLIVFITIVASGTQYVWVWGRKALTERRARCG
jgi:cardiolipin synthase